MAQASMLSGTISVTEPTFNPYLLSGNVEIVRGGSWPSYMEGGPITIGSDIYDAFMKSGGEGPYVETDVVSIDGSAVASESIIGAPSWSETWRDKFSRFTVRMKGQLASYLDASHTEAGKSFTVDHIIRYTTTGETATYRLFTGVVRSGETTWDGDDGVPVTLLEVEDMAGALDRKKLTLNASLDNNPYNAVYQGENDECDLLALDTTNTVTIKAGKVLIDRTKLGGFGDPDPWPMGGNSGGSSGTYGGIVTVSVPETTLDLSTIQTVTIDDFDVLGLKSIIVTNDGVLTVIDGQAPPDSVTLWNLNLQYVGQQLTEERFTDQRKFAFPDELKNRAEILRFALEKEGIDTSSITFPSVNNDRVSNPIGVTEKPILQWIEEWCRPSLWRFRYDREGNPTVWADSIRRSPVGAHWSITQNNALMARVAGPVKASDGASADVTIRGMKRRNNGPAERTEERTSVAYAKVPTKSSAGALGGAVVGFFDSDLNDKVRPVSVVKIERTYKGNSIFTEKRTRKAPRNPINFKGAIAVGKAGPHGPFDWDSSEFGFSHLFNDEQMMTVEIKTVQHVFENRIYRGRTEVTKQLYNPVSHDSGSTGFGLPRGMGHGFVYDEEKLITVSVLIHEIVPDINGFIKSETTTEFRNFNPMIDGEGVGYGSTTDILSGGAQAIGMGGHLLSQEKLLKVSENTLEYSKVNSEEIEIQKTTKGWEKKSGGRSNGVGPAFKPGGALGHTQGQFSGGSRDVERKRGTLPVVQGLEDDIDRIPLGVRVTLPAVEAALGLQDSIINEEVEYCETIEMCDRLARWTMADRLSVQWVFQIGLNPALTLGDTVEVTWNTEGGRRYFFRGIVTAIAPKIGFAPTDGSSMVITVETDYNDMNVASMLAGRT